jgi:hypothetical protein
VDPKKKPDAKAKGAMEEISDNRPRVVNLEKELSEIKITEDIAKMFVSSQMKIEIFEFDKESNEEKFKESYNLDLSQLLFSIEENSSVIDILNY